MSGAPHDLTQIVLLARRASMSTSYKPALLKALARIVRRDPRPRKLVEEAREALESSTHDELLLELADLSEVIVSLSVATGIAPEAVEAMRLRCRDDRGGFERRLLLRHVDRTGPPASP